ncbi:MAG: hypothetical protein ACRD9Q_06470 [Nitrososphaeraceae archaeon]
MGEIEVAGEYGGIGGKFKRVSSYPVVLQPCEHLVDMKKIDKTDVFLSFHGGNDGSVTILNKRILVGE